MVRIPVIKTAARIARDAPAKKKPAGVRGGPGGWYSIKEKVTKITRGITGAV
jgi:hypothetical protein